ncbi:MAG: sulfite exporter TauE/SafE family protein [Promethearchaeota archaeon]
MEFTWQLILILILCGILFGTLTTMAGEGGGIFFVSFMVLVLGMAFDEARDTSIFIILIASGSAFFTYLKQGRTDIKLSLIFSSFAILGSILCWIFLIFFPVSNESLKIIFGLVLLVTATNMIFKTYKDSRSSNSSQHDDFDISCYDCKKDLKKGIPFFMAAGFASRLIGIGGGIIHGPSLHMVFGFPIHNATAVSSSIVFFTAIFNTALLIFYGKINYQIGILLGMGSVIGAIIGAKISHKMPKMALQIFVATLLIFVGVNMLFAIIAE